MAETTVFNRLAKQLSEQERREMFERIRRSVAVSDAPLYADDEPDAEPEDPNESYRKLPFLRRLLIVLAALFSRTDIETQVKRYETTKLARSIEQTHQGLVDFKRSVLLPGFHRELAALRDAVLVFAEALGRAIGRNRQEFIAFLAGIEIPETQGRLLRDTDPETVHESFTFSSERDLKQELERRLEDDLALLPDDDRKAMLANCRLVVRLRALSAFPYERILGEFDRRGGEIWPCPFRDVRPQLQELANVLSGVKHPPSAGLLEALFLFQSEERLDDEDFRLEDELSARIGYAEQAFDRIRLFNRQVPINAILRILNENRAYRPVPIGGGEEWLTLYRQFWRARIEELWGAFVRERRRETVLHDASGFVGETIAPRLEFYRLKTLGEDTPPRWELSLAFVLLFVRKVFIPEMNRILKILLIDGEFYKNENRVAFTDSYDLLLKVEDEIKSFDLRFAPDGDVGASLAAAMTEPTNRVLRTKKLATILSTGDRAAEAILLDTAKAIDTLVKVLDGILYGEVGGQYDTLANLGYLNGKNSRGFQRGLEHALEKAGEAHRILEELIAVERDR